MKPVRGVDGAFLHVETPDTPMHVASLHLFEVPDGAATFIRALRRQMRERVHLAPALTRKLAEMPAQFANPVWLQDDDIEWAYHLQHIRLAAPGTQAQLEELAGRLHSELLDRSRPLWRMAVIDGLQSGHAACYFQVHHAVLDGQAGVLLSQVLFDTSPEPPPVRRRAAKTTGEHPSMVELASAALKHDAEQYLALVRHLPDAMKAVAGLLAGDVKSSQTGKADKVGKPARNLAMGPSTLFNVPVTGERTFATASVPLETLKRLAAAHEAKLNDVLLALCSGAVRRYLAARGALPAAPLIATVPISLRRADDAEYTTQATLSLVNLNTQIDDPVERLQAIRDSAAAMKAVVHGVRNVVPTDFPTIGVPWLLQGFATLFGRWERARATPPLANVVVSNVPGPVVPLYSAGARMVAYWPLSIVEHGLGLNITAMSYAGTMGFGFTAARCAVPEPAELAAGLHASLDELHLHLTH